MAFEVVPTAAGRLHSDQYTKIIIINTPINLRVFPCCTAAVSTVLRAFTVYIYMVLAIAAAEHR